MSVTSYNIAERLRESARRSPTQRAVVFPAGKDKQNRVTYSQLTFQQLDHESDRLARGLQQMGVSPGCKMVLMVKPSLEFITLTFALFKSGAVTVLIDPGMGRSNIFRCLEEIAPDGFVAIPLVHVIRIGMKHRFPDARYHVTVGRKLFWGGQTYQQLLGKGWTEFQIPVAQKSDPAAIIFTSGSTGPPKGVLYEHGMFNAQVDLLQQFYQIQPGEVDLPGFPLFALFNSAMQVTTVIPDMDPTKPAQVDPLKILEAIENQGVTQAFGSPALWNRVGKYCETNNVHIPTLKRILSAGAPVPVHVIQRMKAALIETDSDLFTPYGATESLPVASISGTEVLKETALLSSQGKGTCVGHIFPEMKVHIIPIENRPIEKLSETTLLPLGEVGEIIVQGPVVTREYFQKAKATQLAKIADDLQASDDSLNAPFWHRMGDVGYLDEQHRLWICGRKAHIVETENGKMFTIPCEAIFNEHPKVYRSALVGTGESGRQKPVIIIEPEAGMFPTSPTDQNALRKELLEMASKFDHTASIQQILFHKSLPVDIRHNVKIFREKLSPWAEEQLKTN